MDFQHVFNSTTAHFLDKKLKDIYIDQKSSDKHNNLHMTGEKITKKQDRAALVFSRESITFSREQAASLFTRERAASILMKGNSFLGLDNSKSILAERKEERKNSTASNEGKAGDDNSTQVQPQRKLCKPLLHMQNEHLRKLMDNPVRHGIPRNKTVYISQNVEYPDLQRKRKKVKMGTWVKD